MGRKRTPGLQKRGEFWVIDKKVFGRRFCESTGASDLEEAEKYLARRLEEIRLATVYGVRPKRSFMEAATKFLMENQHKRSLADDAGRLRELIKYIGDISLEAIHIGALQPFIEGRRKDGVSTRTINHGLQLVRRILNLAASEWMDEYGLTWIINAPKIKLLPEHDLRKPYPLNWDEQHRLFNELPSHLKKMALFAVNTGCRDQEVCGLRWDWEIKIPELPHILVFIIPAELVKNGEERLVVCNDTARSVVEEERGKHPTHVFSFRGRPLARILSTGWRQARTKVNLQQVRVHDLKHTFGRRLRAAGVSFEDRQDLLGHRSGRITTHYSSAELQNLYDAANKVCEKQKSGVVLTLLRNPNLRMPANKQASKVVVL
ncbi:tyrosine-type recombinase/integrase [Legionella maceachernii]|uniref:Integrase n=2 Tax=Legionella maceachernii TaxID=466 RepID=A0A0W0VUN3_9GAMM|nr:site-specific integrase [Legionella maceachernii]KTD23952.1 integrase [Legionella maceachernii]SKA18916.1 Site-specific recombinase XerD [Legionella maceachernii]SUP04463.1 site-specific tyrosine recombinase XerC [Legionella maceachernii]